jgi:kumamolisin
VTFGQPAWQASAGVPANPGGKPGRGVPDVAGNADPATGYQVLVDGQQAVIGGTSAVAPLWAALAARLVQAGGKPLGLLQQVLYAGGEPGMPVAGLRDITKGSNGAYSAGPGWDACTGLGVPVGTALEARLAAAGTAGGTTTGGTVTGGTVAGGTIAGGTITGGTITGGTITGGTITGATITGATITGGTITGATATTGGAAQSP